VDEVEGVPSVRTPPYFMTPWLISRVVDEPLSDPPEDAAAWARFRHRESLQRRTRWIDSLKLAWFVIPALLVAGSVFWLRDQIAVGPHATDTCFKFSCVPIPAANYPGFLALGIFSFGLLAAGTTILGYRLFFGTHPPFPIRSLRGNE
jgi:hypothetical protein